MPAFHLDHVLATERDTLKFRLLALLVITTSLALGGGSGEGTPLGPSLGLVGGYLVYAFVVDQYLLPRYQNLLVLGLMLAADTGTLLAALALIGLSSPVFIFLPVLVVYYSLYLGYVGSLTAATVVSLGYALLAVTVGRGQNLGDIVSVQVPFFYMIALLTGYLASQRLREREEKRALQHVMETETSTRAMLDLARRVQEALDPGAIAGDLARLGARMAKAPVCAIYRVEDDGRRHLVGLAASGAPEGTAISEMAGWLEPLHELAAPPVDGEAGRYTYRQGVRLKGPMSPGEGGGDGGLLAMPLLSEGGSTWGVVYFFGEGLQPPEGQAELEALQGFAEHAGAMLVRMDVFPQALRRSAQVVSDLRLTLESLGRFRELQARRPIRVGELEMDPAGERAALGERPVSLSRTEFDVLYLLAEKAGHPVGPETLLHEVWGADFVAQGNVVDVCVHRLRRKLSRANPAAGSRLIQTVRGRGYMLREAKG